MGSSPKVGVYVCHCGSNIAGVIDCEDVAKYASTLEGVVIARDNKYMCADPGQALIKDDVRNLRLNRVVVAACSPRMHEPTFRKCVADAGLNPYLVEMANIREQCSWCHSHEPEGALDKAKDMVAAAVAKARGLEPLETIEVPVTRRALVVGGGVSGIHAALDLADMGFEIVLVERSPSIGGRMAQLDKTFPTLDCSICILGPKMVEAARHPNIRLLTYSEVMSVEGYVGNFRVRVLERSRHVDAKKCNSCGKCIEVCPIEVPSEFDMNLGWRKAIYIPFPQAVPASYLIDEEHCLGLLPLACTKCREACEKHGGKAVDYDIPSRFLELQVGTIVVATGYDPYDPSNIKEYGYGAYPNVLTTLELERMINASGPTNGNVIRPSDGKSPKRVAFIQCVGSRDMKYKEYCSGFCCMVTIKNAVLLKEKHPESEIHVFYMDIRAPFKGYEEFYNRARDGGVVFIRGRPAEIAEDPVTKNLVVYSENQLKGENISLESDMVILSTASIPKADSEKLARIVNIPIDSNGFFMESHPKLKPIDTSTEGIFVCGSAQGLKDIPYSVSQGSAAAARAARILLQGKWEIEPIVATINPERCRNVRLKCGVCVEKCPYRAIAAPERELARITAAMCHRCGTCVAECPADAISQPHFTDSQIFSQIHTLLSDEPEKKILAFLCNWCSYAGADMAGTSRFEYRPNARSIRVMCSGRVDRDFVMEAFRMGVGMVLVSGCELTEYGSSCHYISGNVHAKKRIESLRTVLEKIGISPERLRLEWISAAEGYKFARVINEMAEKLRVLGGRVPQENERARPFLERMLKHLSEGAPVPQIAIQGGTSDARNR